jgi:hypothetical protein
MEKLVYFGGTAGNLSHFQVHYLNFSFAKNKSILVAKSTEQGQLTTLFHLPLSKWPMGSCKIFRLSWSPWTYLKLGYFEAFLKLEFILFGKSLQEDHGNHSSAQSLHMDVGLFLSAKAQSFLLASSERQAKGVFGYGLLKFNTHHINVPSNTWSTKCRLIACMSAQIRSNLRDESIKPN